MDNDNKRKRLTPEEQLANIKEKQAQLKSQEQAIKNRQKDKERKARTRRLIEKGALAETYLGGELTLEQFKSLLDEISQQPYVKDSIRKFTTTASMPPVQLQNESDKKEIF